MHQTSTPEVDVPGLIRRTRRTADLSQRDLAARLGVDQSTVARWEMGETIPDVLTFARLLAVAGLDLKVVDAAGESVPPMAQERPRDRQRRRFPAHLDVVDEASLSLAPRRLTVPHRARRDRLRGRFGERTDHPTWAMLDEEERHRRAERRARRMERLTSVRPHPPLEPPPCSCPVECEEMRGCLPGCGCACEPVGEPARAG